MPELTRVRVADVREAGRARRDMGDLSGLALSMSERGLLQPIGLKPDMTLVFGGRRLAAARRLGWDAIPAIVFESLSDAAAALKAERDENLHRKEMTPTELVELGRALEELERSQAAERKAANLKHGTEPPKGQIATSGDPGKTRDKVAAALGVSGKTYEKAKQVVAAAGEDPEAFGDLPAVMDGRSVDAAYREMRDRQEALPRREEPVPLVSPDPGDGSPEPPEADDAAGWTESERERRVAVEAGGTVLANQKADARLIAWAGQNGLYVRIDRGSAWGNPFVLGEDGDRAAVIRKYGRYFAMKDGLNRRLSQLRGRVLGCWCFPDACHGNHLIDKLGEVPDEHDAR